ncbi:Lytic transglycosylase catalytic (fragment) [uncultured Desulfobacterium sp.]|uniref:Lytic transglycosylase catalytic n=1 Tax=uncultured Desulfobacterium sp. TaxID=201089 RepID=A0A445MUS9_9BACT
MRKRLKSIKLVFRGIGLCFALITFAALSLPTTLGFAAEQDDPLPSYPSLMANVAFWKKVYAQYSTTQGIIHDARNLNIIYEVITLKDWFEPGAYSYNDAKESCAKGYYQNLLKRIVSADARPSLEQERVLGLFAAYNAKNLLKDAHLNVRMQLGQKDRFLAGLIRSGKYLDEIRRILRAYDLPEDLAYLPHVESSFNYQASSKCGAAGIWQFTNPTGRRFMTINHVIDERRDPIIATHAAARLLKENYRMLGEWPTALTAYNHGPGGMLRAQRIKGGYENIFKYYNGPSFGFASRNFYSEFLAAREIARNYQAYFGEIELDEPVYRDSITLPGHIAIKDLARHFCVDIDTLEELNPSLRSSVISGRQYVPKGYCLYLPSKMASDSTFTAENIPPELFKSIRKSSLYCRVRPGDTANKIAKRYGVQVRDLIHANGLNAHATIRLGQNLRIPTQKQDI